MNARSRSVPCQWYKEMSKFGGAHQLRTLVATAGRLGLQGRLRWQGTNDVFRCPGSHCLCSTQPYADQVIFFAGHGNLSITDTGLLGHYSYQLAQAKGIAMWVLLYRPEVDGMDSAPVPSCLP